MSARGAARLAGGHLWVYRSDVVSAQAAAGDLVTVHDRRGRVLGSAFYSSASEIALRLLSSRAVAESELAGLLRQRLEQAIDYRRRVVRDSNAFRLVFSEADSLPGLIVDRYNDVLSLQILTQSMDRAPVRQAVVDTLVERMAPAGIVERAEARIRQLEKLPPVTDRLLAGGKTATVVSMNGVRLHYDALAGQKTGAFLDQRENYAAAAAWAHGDALDMFCYQGGFALHLAGVCRSVTGVDSSRPALEAAERNAALNQAEGRPEIEWIEGNAFDLLKDYAAAGRQFDTIVLDPPAFARSRRSLPTALRGYKEINLRAMKMLRPGGVLVTCSCSYHVSETEFMETLRAAAADAHRTLRVLERRGQAKDHPVMLSVPETAYLKCIILSVTY
ncbi:MAG TPA: class I SAM-dependent rRNA methyltransferase [Terriglobales bacterium]|nr:class I SAM-dependent rRNA methyltransferase [Terriglobales bacterium]